jgi:6-phosphogluconolactonase
VTRIAVAATPIEAAHLAATRIAGTLSLLRRAGRPVHLALAGGGTPRPAYELLASHWRDWTGVSLWLGDERMVPIDDSESNFKMISEALLSPAGIPADQAHPVKIELGEDAAADYERSLKEHLPVSANGVPALSLAFLGIGRDCHTASLFPHHAALREQQKLCVIVPDSPKPPPRRLTMTFPMLNAAHHIVLLACGEAKAAAVAGLFGDPSEECPASLLVRDRLELILDEAAARMVPSDRRS